MYKLYPKIFVQPPRCTAKILLMMNSAFRRISDADKRKWMMRANLTTVLLITAILQVSASSYAQKINLSEKKVPIQQVFDKISTQTGYDFLFSDDILKDAKPISIEVKSAELKSVLNQIFDGQPLEYSIEDKSIVVSKKVASVIDKFKTALAIPVTVTGRVTDTTGAALPGATVSIKGQSNNVLTDKDGNFTFSAEPGTEVSVTFIGFKPYTFKATENLPFQNIVLHTSASKLDEVVVNTGYERISKERATGSYDFIDNKTIERKISTDIISRIEDLTPGTFFDRAHNNGGPPVIRGISTLDVNSDPLIIVDNFPYSGDIKNINPNDVQNISILKDAAATSIWGARAGNGVIVITTKKGSYNSRPRIDFRSSVNITNKPDLFAAKQMSTSEYIDVEKFLFKQGAYDDALADNRRFPIVSEVAEILQKQKTGVLSESAANAQIDALRGLDIRNDYLKYLYRKSVNQQYQLNLSGGDQQINYYFSAGYDKNLANLVGNQDNRFTFSNRTTIRPLKKLELNIGLQYTNTTAQNNNLGGTLNQTRNYQNAPLTPYTQLKDANGNNADVGMTYRKSFTDTAGHGLLLPWNYNPLDELARNNNVTKSSDWLLNVGSNYKITDFMNFDVKYQFETASSIGEVDNSVDGYYTRNLINRISSINDNTVIHPMPVGDILDRSTGGTIAHNARAQLNFDKNFGQHHFIALAGFEISQSKIANSASRLYGYDPNTLIYNNTLDYLTYFPNYDNLDYGEQITSVNQLGEKLNRNISRYANASYLFSDRYLITGSIRRDESNLFGVNTNQKGVPLWSVGGAWNLSNEKFYRFNLIPILKLKYTYGSSGNVNTTISALPTIYFANNGTYSVNGLPIAVISNYANPDLRWEKVVQHNLGLEFGSKDNIISGSFDYYLKKSRDLISGAPADPTIVGSLNLTKNVAELKGHGFDATLTAKIMDNEFHWSSNLTASYNKTIVSKYFLLQTYPSGYVGSGFLVPIEGSNIYNLIAYKWSGLDGTTGDPQGYYQGKVSKDYSSIINTGTWGDLVTKGSAIPMYYGNFRNDFAYKNLSLSINITYKLDYYFRKNALNYNALFSGNIGNSEYTNRWQKPGDEVETNVPSMVYPGNSDRDQFYALSEVNVLKGDNIRLKDCNISYDLGKWAKRVSLNGLQVYTYINDIGLIIWRANKQGLDPDTPDGIKFPRTIGFGLKASL